MYKHCRITHKLLNAFGLCIKFVCDSLALIHKTKNSLYSKLVSDFAAFSQ